jgi:peroxiredoxin Q/BCP
LVELQRSLKKIEAAGTQVVGISYDAVDVLADFARQGKIEFPLLSDEGSKTIKAYGILNPEGNGFPHPGTFLIDQKGIVRAKIFKGGYRIRHSIDELLKESAEIK